MVKQKNVIHVGLTLFTGFLLIGMTGIFDDLNQLCNQVIENNPLPKYYFHVYFVLGLILPILFRFYSRKRTTLNHIFDSYLILFFFQIVSELVVVLLIGKGISVLVGLVFSCLRVIQLKQFLSISKESRFINRFLYFQLTLWSFNVLQILLNRILYLMHWSI